MIDRARIALLEVAAFFHYNILPIILLLNLNLLVFNLYGRFILNLALIIIIILLRWFPLDLAYRNGAVLEKRVLGIYHLGVKVIRALRLLIMLGDGDFVQRVCIC